MNTFPCATHDLPVWAGVLLVLVALTSLACSTGGSPSSSGSNDLKFGFQEGPLPESGASTSTSSKDSAGSYVPKDAGASKKADTSQLSAGDSGQSELQRAQHDLGMIPAPTLATLQRAAQAGLPMLTEDQQIAGPFDGAQNSVFYMNGSGLVSFYLPDYHAAYFAQARPFRWVYGISMAGYFAFDQHNNYLELAQAPEQLLAWPLAYPIAERIAEFAHAYIEDGKRVAQGAAPDASLKHRSLDDLSEQEQTIFWEAMGKTSSMMNETTVTVIEHIGGQGCISHYEDTQFLGCY